MQKIMPETLVPLDLFTDVFPVRVDLAYLKPAPANIFGVIYHPEARLWLFESLAKVVLLSSIYVYQQSRMRLVLYDGLRTIDAQKKMQESPIVKKNPQWLEESNRLLSPPGAGGHPRGLAIDMTIEQLNGMPVDMGTDFDFLAVKADAKHNAAHREYVKMETHVRKNREILNSAVRLAAEGLQTEIVFLPQEWWDFRLPPHTINQYAPLSDSDLPPQMRMTAALPESMGRRDLPEEHFKEMRRRLCAELAPLIAALKPAKPA